MAYILHMYPLIGKQPVSDQDPFVSLIGSGEDEAADGEAADPYPLSYLPAPAT